MNFLLNRHASNAFLSIRFVKIFHLGFPVCPKSIFLGIRLVCSSFFMRSVCPKSIFNGSRWYEVDYLLMWTLWRSFSKYWVSSIWISLKCTFLHPVPQRLIFRASGYSQNHIFMKLVSCNPVFLHSVCPKSIFNNPWWFEVDYLPSTTHFSCIWCHQYEFSNKKACLKCTFMLPVCQKLIFGLFG